MKKTSFILVCLLIQFSPMLCSEYEQKTVLELCFGQKIEDFDDVSSLESAIVAPREYKGIPKIVFGITGLAHTRSLKSQTIDQKIETKKSLCAERKTLLAKLRKANAKYMKNPLRRDYFSIFGKTHSDEDILQLSKERDLVLQYDIKLSAVEEKLKRFKPIKKKLNGVA